MPLQMTRRQYAEMFGPTVGDQVRLADTELFIEVERDFIAEAGARGDEVKFGGGKVIRDGMGQSPTATDAESLDLVITNDFGYKNKPNLLLENKYPEVLADFKKGGLPDDGLKKVSELAKSLVGHYK